MFEDCENLIKYWIEKKAGRVWNEIKTPIQRSVERVKRKTIPFYETSQKIKEKEEALSFSERQAKNLLEKNKREGKKNVAKTVAGVGTAAGAVALSEKSKNKKEASVRDRVKNTLLNRIIFGKQITDQALKQREIENIKRLARKEKEKYDDIAKNILGFSGIAGAGYMLPKLISGQPTVSIKYEKDKE